jgi:peptide/nickel transport system permease protein
VDGPAHKKEDGVTATPAQALSTTSRWLSGPRRLVNRSARVGAGLLTALVVFSLAGQVLLPDPNRQRLTDALQPPGTSGHPFGTDPLGRDLLAWIAGGITTSITVAVSVAALAAAVGVAVGLVAGYFGGVVDAVLMRLVDLNLAIPPLLLFIAVTATVQPSRLTLILLLTFVAWVPYARLIRSKVLVERGKAYVSAARLAGSSTLRIMAGHLLPVSATPIFVLFTLQAGYVLLWEAGLSFLGLGVTPPSTSLGYMLSEGRTVMVDGWWVAALPGLTIVALVLGFNMLGDGLRDLFHDEDADGVARS